MGVGCWIYGAYQGFIVIHVRFQASSFVSMLLQFVLQEFKMTEVVNPEITIEAVAMDQSRINHKLKRIEDTKQLNQINSTKISDVSDFLGLLKDASEL
ncbi:hypothetical protein GIB67_042113, partial [Kingdonia uniflora]